MHDDDRPVGRLFSRRAALALLGVPATAGLAGDLVPQGSNALPSVTTLDCVAQPEQTEGPFFVDRSLERSDIRLDPMTGRGSDGAVLSLQFVLLRPTPTGLCAALPGAQVDIWQCDAMGVYSGVADRRTDTLGQQFLRGHQMSDTDGIVRFTTIYPGWYPGRAVHIHFKVRVPATSGRVDEFTSQLYFEDELTDRVHAGQPYAAHRGQRLQNSRDMIFREGGTQLVLPVVEQGDVFAATYRIGIQPGVARRSRPIF